MLGSFSRTAHVCVTLTTFSADRLIFSPQVHTSWPWDGQQSWGLEQFKKPPQFRTQKWQCPPHIPLKLTPSTVILVENALLRTHDWEQAAFTKRLASSLASPRFCHVLGSLLGFPFLSNVRFQKTLGPHSQFEENSLNKSPPFVYLFCPPGSSQFLR